VRWSYHNDVLKSVEVCNLFKISTNFPTPFQQNSFEQFCINYTNERLQQFFNQFMFVREQRDYIAEGIEWAELDFGLDLQPTIDMIEQPMGLLALLQEECIVPNGSDQSLLDKLLKQLGKHKAHSQVFSKAKVSSKSAAINHFSVQHYAGQVAYNLDGWLEKNRDLVDANLLDVLSASEHPLMGRLFGGTVLSAADTLMTRSRRGSLATATVSYIYKEQLSNLLHTLNSTSAHFIRCIVPNYERRAFMLDGPLVLRQLRCNGVLEGIRICRRGYPNRELFAQFHRRYKLLGSETPKSAGLMSDRELVGELCTAIGIDSDRYQLGRSKIFCKAGLISELEMQRRARIDASIARLQAHCRWWLEQRRLHERLREHDAVEIVQQAVKQHVGVKMWEWYRMWRRVRELIPLVRDRKRLQELEEENVKLGKVGVEF